MVDSVTRVGTLVTVIMATHERSCRCKTRGSRRSMGVIFGLKGSRVASQVATQVCPWTGVMGLCVVS